MKVTKAVVMEEETWDKISELAEKSFTSNSAIIRQAIAEKIERESKKEE